MTYVFEGHTRSVILIPSRAGTVGTTLEQLTTITDIGLLKTFKEPVHSASILKLNTAALVDKVGKVKSILGSAGFVLTTASVVL